jgi:hypothetical protein
MSILLIFYPLGHQFIFQTFSFFNHWVFSGLCARAPKSTYTQPTSNLPAACMYLHASRQPHTLSKAGSLRARQPRTVTAVGGRGGSRTVVSCRAGGHGHSLAALKLTQTYNSFMLRACSFYSSTCYSLLVPQPGCASTGYVNHR